MLVGSFGSTVFEVSYFKILTLEKLKRTTRANYEEHKILNHVSKLEFTGLTPLQLEISIKLVQNLGVNPELEAEKLRQICTRGEAYYLVLGNRVVGNCLFVIEEISEDVEIWSGANPGVLNLSLKLRQYQ